ncbi:DUF6188 family protein [Gimesia chilikensis]|uniref:Uncharacterized protein n=1 Tax=Gimesia chilikensis TaxID=2605989 RepID=A0A517PZ62_9PLAN|nr:DUF6188 family protein [Gimesia chilikensis]QDT24671.1 hypothetical protein HG66A1_65060 [Gimesia chilikensis]
MKTLSYSGRNLLLPLAGDTLIAFQETGLTGLVFADEEAVRSLIEFEDELQITDVDGSRTLRGTKPGAGFWRADLERLDYLLGYRLMSAIARHDGCLTLEFETGARLEVQSTTGYEAWHFQCPLPQTSTKQHPISVYGDHGKLIISS